MYTHGLNIVRGRGGGTRSSSWCAKTFSQDCWYLHVNWRNQIFRVQEILFVYSTQYCFACFLNSFLSLNHKTSWNLKNFRRRSKKWKMTRRIQVMIVLCAQFSILLFFYGISMEIKLFHPFLSQSSHSPSFFHLFLPSS